MEHIQNLLNQVTTISKRNAEILDETGSRFNMFRVCGVNHYETTHSAIIAEFLRPDGTHGLKAKLLECFIDIFCNDTLKQSFKCKNAGVNTEVSFNEGRIDILVKDEKEHAIIIENKIYAEDQWKQLKRYNEFAENKYGKGNYQMVYLTLWGDEASEQSSHDVDYTCISYEKDIIRWMEKCVSIAEHLPMVRETIKQYINHLKVLTNQDMDTKNKEEIIQLLCKPENLKSVFAIGDSFTDIRNHLIKKVFLPQLTSVCEELGLKNNSEECDWVNTPYAGFDILCPSWKVFKIRFEFDKKGLKGLFYGITHIDDNIIRKDKTFEKLKQHFTGSTKKWVYDYPKRYTNWDADAMIAIQKGEMAKLFKQDIEKILELDCTKGLNM